MSQLTNYIQKELDKGFDKDLITKKLLQAGYTKDEINESFKSLKSSEPLLRRKLIDTIHEDAKVIRSKWLFPVIGIILLIVFVYLVFQYIGVTERVTGCDGISDIQEKDICYLTLAASGEDVCEKISTAFIKTACEQQIWALGDCTYEILIDKDPETCLLNKAIETKDTRYCTMQEEHTDCLLMLATTANDKSFCEGNPDCLQEYSIEQKDPSACTGLVLFADDCYDAYAAETGDTSICDKGTFLCGFPYGGTEEQKKTFIESKISLLSTEVEEGENYSRRDIYLYKTAERLKDNIFCNYILTQELQEGCYE